MIDYRTITCTNDNAVSCTFGYYFTPFVLVDASGIYGADFEVSMTENTMTDGSTYHGTTVKQRNIVLTVADKEDHRANRELLYAVFKPRAFGTLVYRDQKENFERQIGYQVESINIEQGASYSATISLLCPDPYFEETTDHMISISEWQGHFMFPHMFPTSGEPIGSKSDVQLTTIRNDYAGEDLGLTFRITVSGNVKNPSITHVEKNQIMQIGTDAMPLNLIFGDVLEITTGINNKHVYLIRSNMKTEINQYLSEQSEYIQLSRGNNTIGYSAASGVSYMAINISYRYRYLGV